MITTWTPGLVIFIEGKGRILSGFGFSSHRSLKKCHETMLFFRLKRGLKREERALERAADRAEDRVEDRNCRQS